jgi:hypothetical protein
MVADKEARTVHTINIISQQQYFVPHWLGSHVGNVFGLHSICILFSFYQQASNISRTHIHPNYGKLS